MQEHKLVIAFVAVISSMLKLYYLNKDVPSLHVLTNDWTDLGASHWQIDMNQQETGNRWLQGKKAAKKKESVN